jgi:hypothetical protein
MHQPSRDGTCPRSTAHSLSRLLLVADAVAFALRRSVIGDEHATRAWRIGKPGALSRSPPTTRFTALSSSPVNYWTGSEPTFGSMK